MAPEDQYNTNYSTSHYAIYLAHRNSGSIYIEDLKDGYDAMYSAKLMSKIMCIKK